MASLPIVLTADFRVDYANSSNSPILRIPIQGLSLRVNLKGIIPAMITPFTNDEELDEEALRGHVRFLIKTGISGIMCNGSTGESSSLSHDERRKVIETVVDEVGGVMPVIAGTGASSTRETVELTRDATEAGANAVMIVAPYYLIPDVEGVYVHYKKVTESVDIPVVVYNIPQHTRVNIDAKLLKRLAVLKNIVAIKDSSGNLSQFSEMIKLVGSEVLVLTGADDLIFPSFVLGSPGAILAVANIAPRMAVEILDLVQRGEVEKAREVNSRLLPIARAISVDRKFPAQVKEAVAMLGRPAGPTRKPILSLTSEEKEEVRQALLMSGLAS